MGGTGETGSSSGKAVGFDPGGLWHFSANSATARFKLGHSTLETGQHPSWPS